VILSDVLRTTSEIVAVVGVIIILWGATATTVNTIRQEIAYFRRRRLPFARLRLRQQFGSSLLLGLEFLIAADVIRTALQPTVQEIMILGGIVAIRTVIGYFLHKEMADDRGILLTAQQQEHGTESEK